MTKLCIKLVIYPESYQDIRSARQNLETRSFMCTFKRGRGWGKMSGTSQLRLSCQTTCMSVVGTITCSPT